MIKYILSTGIGIMLCSMVSSQLITADEPEIYIPENNSTVAAVISTKDKKRFDLPEEGDVAAHANKTALYSGTVKRHKLHGSWLSWYRNQNLCDSGTFFKGLPVGEWKHWDINGQLTEIRHYDATRLLRIKNEMLRSNPKQVVYPLTALYKKNRRKANQYMHAGYSFSFTDHHPHHFTLQQAVENNITPGNSYRPLFDECLHHGLYMNFYNGKVKDSGYYKNGLRDGLWIHRSADDLYWLGIYKNGIKQGDWKQYNAANKFLSIIFYDKKGKEMWRKKIQN